MSDAEPLRPPSPPPPPPSPGGRDDMAEARRFARMTPAKIVVQALGGLICLALLAWATRLAFSPENQDALARLRQASAASLLMLLGISVAAIVVDGLIFWLTLRPLRKAKQMAVPRPLEVVGVNAVATFLNPLPFKLGMLARATLHMRLHAVTIREMIAWLAGFAGLTLLAIGALVLATQRRPAVDAVTLGIALAIMLAGGAGVVVVGRLARTRPALQKLSLGAWPMADDPLAVFGSCVLRVSHIVLAALRMLVIAQMLALPLSLAQGVQLGTSYTIVQAAAPTGTLGVAEAITSKHGEALGLKIEEVALMVLVTTAAQTLTAGGMSVLALAWLRPWQSRPRRTEPQAGA